ncbi:unnamed protein product [Rodentolepis nana]|uniref:UPF0568 protein C14orf166 homolog n=1 Tax=Rodentolepis nana TaxID=102285 RepID=A0A0R3TFV0_RODNA|nr:unnamed protein product [Rodentolepis nana]
MSVERVLQRKLEFLGYPESHSFSTQVHSDVYKLLVWLEDKIIRCLPIKERFRDTDSDKWQNYVESYLGKINCPYKLTEPECMVDYLLNRGIELRNDNEESKGETLNPILREDIFANTDSKIADLILTHLAESPEFKEGVQKLSKLLNIPEHPDPKQTFRAICVLIEKMLSEESIKREEKAYDKKIELQNAKDIFLGFDISDPQLRSAAVTLRLIHVAELRNLQDLINHAIVEVQKLTANPKTDASQGQVGR